MNALMNTLSTMSRRWIVTLFVVLATSSSWAQDTSMEIIELRHTVPQDIVPVIRPLLPAGSALSASGNQIIIRTDPNTFAEVKKVVETLDRAPSNLLVTVRNVQRDVVEESGYSISGKVSKGDTEVSVGQPRGDTLRVTADRRRYSTDADEISQLRVLEGQPAFIDTGKTVPYYQGSWYFYGPTVTFQELHSGFFVVPRLQGDRVTMDLRPRNDQLDRDNSGKIDRQAVITTLSGQLGEWITVAGTDRSLAQERRGIVYRTTRSRPEERLIQVKVEKID